MSYIIEPAFNFKLHLLLFFQHWLFPATECQLNLLCSLHQQSLLKWRSNQLYPNGHSVLVVSNWTRDGWQSKNVEQHQIGHVKCFESVLSMERCNMRKCGKDEKAIVIEQIYNLFGELFTSFVHLKSEL